MPAGSEAGKPVGLPHTFRPLGVRIAVYVLGALLVAVAAVVWFTFPPEIQDKFSVLERGTVLVLGLAFLSIGFGLARSRLVARSEGLTVVNGYRTRRFEWNEVLDISLKPGAPWAVLDISDGTSVAALGIQGSDGARANRQVRDIRRLIDRLTRTDQND